MPLRQWYKQLRDTNTDKRREVEGNPNPRCKKKGGIKGGRGEGKQKRPQSGRVALASERAWLASQIPHYGMGDISMGRKDPGLGNSTC